MVSTCFGPGHVPCSTLESNTENREALCKVLTLFMFSRIPRIKLQEATPGSVFPLVLCVDLSLLLLKQDKVVYSSPKVIQYNEGPLAMQHIHTVQVHGLHQFTERQLSPLTALMQ